MHMKPMKKCRHPIGYLKI